MENQGNINDLTNQMTQNLDQSISKKTNNYPNNDFNFNQLKMASGLAGSITATNRGFSRQSKVSQNGNRSIAGVVTQSREFQPRLGSHPNTASSQKRQLPSQAYNQPSTTNTVASKRSALYHKHLHPQQQIEYVPLQTTSYASQKINQAGVGGVSVLNAPTLQFRNTETEKNLMKTEFSIQDQMNNKFSEFIQSKNIVSQSELTAGPTDFKIGNTQKYQVKAPLPLHKNSNTNFMEKRLSNLNQGSNIQKFMLNTEETQPTIEINQTQLQNTQIRKMSYAAKSGQMAVFNSSLVGNQNLNQAAFTENKQYSIPSSQTQDNIPLGSRQFESYLGRRAVVEQQREKKQKLLRQLDEGSKIDSNHQSTTNIQNSPGMGSYEPLDNNYPGTSPLIPRSIDLKIQGQIQGHQNHLSSMKRRNNINGLITHTINNSIQIQSETGLKLSYQGQINSSVSPLRNLNLPRPMDHQKQQSIQQQEFTQYLQAQLSPNHQPQQQQPINIVHNTAADFSALADMSLGVSSMPIYQHTLRQDIEKPQYDVPSAAKVNSMIYRKLDGGRPHKIYDYMFIQISNEQFMKEYFGSKIQVMYQDKPSSPVNFTAGVSPRGNQPESTQKNKFTSHSKTPEKGKFNNFRNQSPQTKQQQLNLKGLVQIKAYDSQLTDELPAVQCNLLPTQLDHLKVLICEQEDKNYPKLTNDALNKFEIEKQSQIKQYMEDIISKLQQKDRRFKVTVKKKFVEDALNNSTSLRVASVYVIVVNRERTYDPMLNQKVYKSRIKMIQERSQDSSTEEDVDEKQARDQYLQRQQQQEQVPRPPGTIVKRSMYDSDTNGGEMNSTSASSNLPQFKKLMADKSNDEKMLKQKKIGISSGVSKRQKTEDSFQLYQYKPPDKSFDKYKTTKIKLIQDINAHNHHDNHPMNVFLNQYNEFIKLVFKNGKQTTSMPIGGGNQAQKINQTYAFGLARAIGMNLKRDALSDANMKSRDHQAQIKEKLIFCFWKKLNEENGDLTPGTQQQPPSSDQPSNGAAGSSLDLELDGETIDSSSNRNNTPKSKPLGVSKQDPSEQSGILVGQAAELKQALQLPPANIVYKYFIGKGNNSIMVRSLFKNRFWWMQHDKEEMEKCNFCWTQNKNSKLMEVLPCKFPNHKSGLKNSIPQSAQQILTATPQNKSSKKKKNISQQNSEKLQPIQPVDIVSTMTKGKLYNKIEDNFHVNNKKALYLNMKNYYEAMDEDVFANLPLTFHVKSGLDDAEFTKFKNQYQKFEDEIKQSKAAKKLKKIKEKTDDASPRASPDIKPVEEEVPQFYRSQMAPKNIWIIKPGENTNRGQGIQVAKEFNEIRDIISDSTTGGKRTCIVQKYIHNPLLIHRRKFDIRTYVLMTSVNGNTKVFIYEEGYLRTSCREYSINNLSNRLVHLTNDAVQKRAEDYGKFEPGNKLSYNEFQLLIDKNYPDLNICFERDIVSQMNKLTTDVFRACHGKLDPKRRLNCMEVFGLDFMIDDEFRTYLIEVNTNPCLELSCPLLARLIPNMLENALKIGLDAQYMPPEHFTSKKAFIGDPCPENRFSLCFDSKIDGPILDKLFETKANIIIEMDEDELSEEELHDD